MTVRLARFHPEFATRSCSDCKRWLYRADGSKMVRGTMEDGGLPLLRPAGVPTPCHECPKVPVDAIEKTSRYAQEPTEQSWKAYQHYLECVAVGRFPDEDAIVRRNAAVIRKVEEAWERMPLVQLAGLLRVTRGRE